MTPVLYKITLDGEELEWLDGDVPRKELHMATTSRREETDRENILINTTVAAWLKFDDDSTWTLASGIKNPE